MREAILFEMYRLCSTDWQVLVPPGFGEDVKTWPAPVPPEPIKEAVEVRGIGATRANPTMHW